MIDISHIDVFDNPADEFSWPATSHLDVVTFMPDGVHLTFSKQTGGDRWPDVPTDWPDDSWQYAIGLVRLVGVERPAASAPIQFWFGLEQNGGDVLQPTQLADNWFYDDRWGPLQKWKPLPGEHVGFFAVAGIVRNQHDASRVPVKERTGVIEFAWPGTYGRLTPVWGEPIAGGGNGNPPPANLPELIAEEFDKIAASATTIARLVRLI